MATDSRDFILKAALRFGLDARSAASGLKSIRDFRSEIERLQKQLRDLRAAERAALASNTDASQFTEQIKNTEDAIKSLAETVDEQLNRAFYEAGRQLQKIEVLGMNLFQAAGALQEIGASLTFDDQLRQYQQIAKESDTVITRYDAASKRILEANSRVGRIVAESWTPILENTATFQEGIAKFVESNPALLNAAVNVGSTIATLSSLASAMGRGLRIYADIKQVQISTTQLLAAQIMKQAADQQLQAAGLQAGSSTGGMLGAGGSLLGKVGGALGTVAKVALPAVIAAQITASITDAIRPPGTPSIGESLGMVASFISGGATFLTSGGDRGAANKSFQDTAKLYGVVKDAADDANTSLRANADAYGNFTLYLINAEKKIRSMASANGGFFSSILGPITNGLASVVSATSAISATNDPVVQAYIDYRTREGEAEQQYQSERLSLITGSLKDQLKAQQDFNKQTGTNRREFDKREADTFRQFSEQRLSDITAFNKSEAATDAQAQADRLAALKQFNDNEIDLDAEYQRQLAKQLADFAKSEARTERDYQRGRDKDAADFIDNEAATEADYYAQRLKSAEDFGREVLQAEADHQLQMARMLEDYNDSLEEIQNQRDAYGLIKSRREYEKQRRRAEEDYINGLNQRNGDYARQLAEQEKAFADQREQRLADYEKRRNEQQAEFDRQRAERKADFDEQLAEQEADRQREKDNRLADFNAQQAERADNQVTERNQRRADFEQRLKDDQDAYDKSRAQRLTEFRQSEGERAVAFVAELKQLQSDGKQRVAEFDAQYRAESDKRTEDFKNRLNELDETLLGERGTRLKYYKLMADDLAGWLGAMRASVTGKPFDITAPSSLFTPIGPPSPTLNYSPIPSPSSSTSPLSLLTGGNSSPMPNMSINQNFTFVGSMSDNEKQWYKKQAYDQAVVAVNDVLDGVRHQ